MKRQIARAIHSERGTAVVEFAILAPVLIFLLIGLVEIGRYTYFALLASNAARAGVQYGAQTTGTAADVAGMQFAASGDGAALPSSWGTPAASNYCLVTNSDGSLGGACPATGTPQANWTYFVRVTVSGTINPIFHYPGIPTSVPISATAVMRVANQ